MRSATMAWIPLRYTAREIARAISERGAALLETADRCDASSSATKPRSIEETARAAASSDPSSGTRIRKSLSSAAWGAPAGSETRLHGPTNIMAALPQPAAYEAAAARNTADFPAPPPP